MEEGLGMGCPSPRDADDGARVLRTLLGVGGVEGLLQQGGGDGREQAVSAILLSLQVFQALASQTVELTRATMLK